MERKKLIRELNRELSRVEGLLLEEPDSSYLQRRRLSLCRQLYLLYNPKRIGTGLTYTPPERVPVYNHCGYLMQTEEREPVGMVSPKRYRDRGSVVTWAIYLEDRLNGFWDYERIRRSS